MVNIPKHFLNEEQGFIEELETHPALRLKYNTLYPIILNKYKKKRYVETGLWLGHGIKVALACEFDLIYSCDIDSRSTSLGEKLYGHYKNVNIYHSDSREYLEMLFQNNELTENVTFFLDAHFGDDATAKKLGGDFISPLLDEINLIAKYCKNKDNIIIIDDYNKIEKWGHHKDKLESAVLSVNKNFKLNVQPRIVEEPAPPQWWNKNSDKQKLKTNGDFLIATL